MILVDAHVHIYDCFDLQTFFVSTLKNFQSAAKRKGVGGDFSAFLFLTDWAKQDWFLRLTKYADSNARDKHIQLDGWQIRPTQDKIALFAENRSGQGFYIIAGRKIITSENLEVLALATVEPIKDGSCLIAHISDIRASGAVPVIPWAPGKWMGHRGRIISDLLENSTANDFFFCDNGNRPAFWKWPSHFKIAERKGIRILSGSDPLHFSSEATRAGSFGFAIPGTIDLDRPALDIKRLLWESSTKLRLYGSLEKPHRFFRNQFTMQIKKRKYRKELTQ